MKLKRFATGMLNLIHTTTFVLTLMSLSNFPVAAQEPIKVPQGFKIVKVADDNLATNIYSLTVDTKGHTVVAGPGYIRRLIDTDADGIYDEALQISNVPINGAQGLYFDDETLFAVGDQGVLRLSDSDNDGFLDQSKVALAIKTGGEHDSHAIRRGPDDKWYLLCGNGVTCPADVKLRPGQDTPHAGFLLRMNEDFAEIEVIADGFRNPYDFDFNIDGDPITFDSDGERDVSLPWYQPTRVYRLRSGDDAGWMTASWKRPDHSHSMPEVLGRLGRGSPSGVVCYQHFAFPKLYHDAAFVLDWTYGRIIAIPRTRLTGEYLQPIEFASPSGVAGFAVTDAEVAPDGSLLVSVGGRGTRGAVYRISWVGQKQQDILDLPPQLNTSWARANWRAEKRKPFSWEFVIDTIFNQNSQSKIGFQIKVIQMTTKSAGPISAEEFQLIKTRNPRVARKLLWSLLQHQDKDEASNFVVELIRRVRNLEYGNRAGELLADLKAAMPDAFPDPSSRLPYEQYSNPAIPIEFTIAQQVNAWFDDLTRLSEWPGNKAHADWPSVFDGYRIDVLEDGRSMAGDLKQVETALRLSGEKVFAERTRQFAFGRIGSLAITDLILKRITEESTPETDIHCLIVLARTARNLSGRQLNQVVDGLLNVRTKIKTAGKNVDRNWPARMRELTKCLIRELNIGDLLASHPALTRNENSYLFEVLSKEWEKRSARMMVADSILADDKTITSAKINFLAADKDKTFVGLVRMFHDERSLTDSVIKCLAANPHEDDRECFMRGFKSVDRNTWRLAANGLRKIARPENEKAIATDSISILKCGLQLGPEKQDQRVAESLIRLLKSWHNQNVDLDFSQWKSFLQKQYPAQFAAAGITESETTSATLQRLAKLDLSKGDSTVGQVVYQEILCSKCHDGGSRLGPSLAGITQRFSESDILRAIVHPDEQIPQRYRALKILTTEGEVIYGAVVYESADGIVLADRQANTLRVNQELIEERGMSQTSLMPAGLLDNASDRDIQDLFSYLRTLR